MTTKARIPDMSPDEEAVLKNAGKLTELAGRVEIELVHLAVQWGQFNVRDPRLPLPGRPEGARGVLPEEKEWEHLEEMGLPLIEEFKLPALAVKLKMSEAAARAHVCSSLMLVHLLPRVWNRVLSGHLEARRAKWLAYDCWSLNPPAIEYIDRQMSNTTTRLTAAQRKSIIHEAKLRFMPDVAAVEVAAALEHRDVRFDDTDETNSLVSLYANLDLPDALALNAAITCGAGLLKEAGVDASLGVRRAFALGDLARAHLKNWGVTHDAFGNELPIEVLEGAPDRPHWDGTDGKGGPVGKFEIFLHLTRDALEADPGMPRFEASSAALPKTGLEGTTVPSAGCELSFEDETDLNPGHPVIRVERTAVSEEAAVHVDVVRGWFTRYTLGACPKFHVTPVLDLAGYASTTAYEHPHRLRQQAILTSGTCVHPFCSRPARTCDIDHIQPWKSDADGNPIGGATCSCQGAPACRSHHLLKTHAQNAGAAAGKHNVWTYDSLGNGEFVWTGPNGIRVLRTNQGTFDYSDGYANQGGTPVDAAVNFADLARNTEIVTAAHAQLLTITAAKDEAVRRSIEIATEAAARARALRRIKHLRRIIELDAQGNPVLDNQRLTRGERARRHDETISIEEAYLAELYADLDRQLLPEDDLPKSRYPTTSFASDYGPPPF